MNYKSIRLDARERLKGNWATAVIAYLVYTAIATAVEGAGFIFGEFFSIIGSLAFIFVYGPLQYGMNNIFLKLNRKEKTDVGDLFVGFSENMSQKISVGVSIYLYTFLWSLLLIVPGIVASYSYSMTYYILKDNPSLTSGEAITRSKEMMKGHKVELFLLDLSFIGWLLLGVLSLGIGLFWVIPYMQAARARFYEELVGPVEVVGPGNTTMGAETVVKNESEVSPYVESADANIVNNVVNKVVCETCGAEDTDAEPGSTCSYCGGKLTRK